MHKCVHCKVATRAKHHCNWDTHDEQGGIPDKVKAVRHREDFSGAIHFEVEGKDMALCGCNVKTESKGKKNVLMLYKMKCIFS